jgi:alkanesulfonate monooxygenase SsuD/methylene tetrahydromethanopterin reductase-like flavin-dependent oxidoreductase (luciferase family)
MKFFLAGLGNRFGNLDLITESVLMADRLGFYGALMPDHYMWGKRDWGKRPDDYITLETWVTLTYLAAKTELIHLGTLVTPIPFRPPTILAKMLSTLDVLSKGRIVLGVGAGWSREEFERYSEWNDPKVRVDKTKEGIELMIKLWTQNEVTFEGKYYRVKGAVLEPKPVQKPYPSLLFGGRGNRMLKLAGRYADICYMFPIIQTPEGYKELKEKVLNAAETVNRKGKITFMAGDLGSRTPYNSKEYFRRVESALEIGASCFIVSFQRNEDFIKSLIDFSKEVIPSFKAE